MKKVAIVTAIDGSIKGLLNAQLLAAMEAGYEVHGACTKGKHFTFLEDEGVIMHDVPISRAVTPFRDMVSFWRLYRLFKKEKFDIVHTHTPKVSLLGQIAAKLAGVPVIINTIHGYYFHEHMTPLKRWFYIVMEWIASRCSAHILSQNPEDIETAVRLGLCKRDKIRLLGNGVDLDKFDPARFDDAFRRSKRAELGFPEDAVIIGIIGRLVREKGYLELFAAFRELIEKHSNLWLMIVGPEEPQKSDRISGQTFKDYNIESRTLWLGYRSDIPELLACWDIYCLPSWREGFPRSAIEAAAMGLPIVTTNIRGCRQVVEDNDNGFLVPLKDINALAQALETLVTSYDLRLKMGQAGYDKSRREFDEKKICLTVLKTYSDCMRLKKK